MEERKLTEKESLEVITSMIARTKQRYIGNGNILLMWGYLVVSTTILVWIMLTTTHKNAWNWLWFAIPVIGCSVTPFMARRQELDYGAVTYSDKVTSQLWTIFGISEIVLTLMCLGFQFLGDINCWKAMLTYTLVTAPVAEIAQGLIIKEKSLIIGGIIGLLAGLITICCVAGGITLYAYWFLPLFIVVFIVMMMSRVIFLIIKHEKRNERA